MFQLVLDPKTVSAQKPLQRVAAGPFLRWAGSKRRLLPKLKLFWGSQYSRYFEPFAGSASLYFELQPPRSVLSDVNGSLIEAFTLVRKSPERVYKSLSKLPLGKDSYYALRAQDPSTLASLDRTARFIFLNRFCFNGLYRTNDAGKFNVPYAATKTGGLPSKERFIEAAKLLQSAELVCGDFETVLLSRVRGGDFVYLDPPYAIQNRRVFRQYGPQTFGLDDLVRLRTVLEEIDRRGAHFVLSYAWCKEATLLTSGWARKRVYTQRNIAGFAKHRRKAVELFATNIPQSKWGAADA